MAGCCCWAAYKRYAKPKFRRLTKAEKKAAKYERAKQVSKSFSSTDLDPSHWKKAVHAMLYHDGLCG